MFVVGASMFYTGLAQEIGGVVVKNVRHWRKQPDVWFNDCWYCTVHRTVQHWYRCLPALPVALGICSAAKIPASRQLMPLGICLRLGWYYHHGWYSS